MNLNKEQKNKKKIKKDKWHKDLNNRKDKFRNLRSLSKNKKRDLKRSLMLELKQRNNKSKENRS